MMRHDSDDHAVRACRAQALTGAAFAGVFVAVMLCLGGNALTYDEPWYLESVGLLHKHGWSAEFLRSLPGPAGPLYSVVHYVCEPVTHLMPPLVRWVNPFMLLIGILAAAAAVRSAGASDVLPVAATFFAIPMTWPCAGMALTEVPAVCAYSLHLFCVTRCMRGGPRHFGWAALAGVALGAGILGRQPLLLGVLPIAYLGMQHPERRSDLILALAAAMTLVLPVFAVWGGVVPPKTAYVAGGVSLRHLFFAGAYAAICCAIVCPDLLSCERGLLAGCLVAGVGFNFIAPTGSWLPMQTLAERLIPPAIVPTAVGLVGGLVYALGIWFFASCAMMLVSRRGDSPYTFIVLSLVLQIVAAMAIKHQFSSRYVLTAVPLFAWLAVMSPPRRFVPSRLCVGAVIGCISLVNYLSMPLWLGM